MSDATKTFPDSAAGRMAERYCLYFYADPDEFDFVRNDEIFHPDLLARWPKQADEVRRESMRKERQTGRAFKALTGVEEISPTEIAVLVEFRNERTFRITLTLEPDPPHRILRDRWDQVYEFDLTVREATEADAAVLSDIERRAPVVTEGVSVATDRGEDYFASARLMDDVTILIAEIDGEPAGVTWGSGHPVIIRGEEHSMYYAFHLRVAPEHQKKGMWGALFGRLGEIYESSTFYGHFSLGNVAWKHVASQSGGPRPGMWSPGVLRARLHT
ncbi:MAG: GNAT family N-acetyltransferase, partial [Candidatus Binatia bacterium]